MSGNERHAELMDRPRERGQGKDGLSREGVRWLCVRPILMKALKNITPEQMEMGTSDVPFPTLISGLF